MNGKEELQFLEVLESLAINTMDLSKLSTETIDKLIKYLQENTGDSFSDELNELVYLEQGWI